MTSGRRLGRSWAVPLVAATLAMAAFTPAAADGSVSSRTYEGPGYSADHAQAPTEAGNQSKLWFHADAWWALLAEPSGRGLRVHELMPDHTWRPTPAVVNADAGDGGDALQDGDTVHVLTRAADQSLYYVRLTFDPAVRSYQVAAPVLVTTRKSGAAATIAEDSAGTLWVGYATAASVIVIPSVDGGATWGRVVQLENDPSGKTPEVASLVGYDDRVGILWSHQATGTFQFASHRAGDDPSAWVSEVARAGPGEAANHINLTTVPGEPADTLVAAVRTSHDAPGGTADSTLLEVLIRPPDGQWWAAPVSTVADGLDDPVLQVDVGTRTLRVFASRDGAIVTKTAPLDAIRFDSGPGDVFVNGALKELSAPSVTKDPVDTRSGLVVLTSDSLTSSYRHAELPLDPSTPVADPADRTPPTAPAGLQARAVSPEKAVLSWDPARDGDRWVPAGSGVPVAGYLVARNGRALGTVTTTAFEDRVRAAPAARQATSITYTVTAVDASGNRSAPTTLVVRLPGAESSRTLVIGAIALLGLAGLVIGSHLLYRRRVTRGAAMPPARQPS
jgi:hypothetical protein